MLHRGSRVEGEKRDERGTREERELAERRRQRRRNETLRERRKKVYPATEIHDFKSRHTMEAVNDVSEIERGTPRARRREKIVRTRENDGVESQANIRDN